MIINLFTIDGAAPPGGRRSVVGYILIANKRADTS
jgi:hypothetical protein